MKKILLISAAVLLISVVATAQKRSIKGFIKDSSTRQPLTDVYISDAFAKRLGHTNSKGYFIINAKEGQTIFFDAPAYHYDTLRLATMTPDTVTLYLVHLPNELAAVTVTTIGYTQYQKDSIKRKQGFEDDLVKKKKTFAQSNTDAGFALNLDPFLEKRQRKRKSDQEIFNEIEESDYVDYRFPRELVSSYTSLKGDDLNEFVLNYRPSYQWLRNHDSDEEVFLYINDKYKLYLKKKK